MTDNYDPDRDRVLKTGEILSGILIPGGERSNGTIAEMQLHQSKASVIVGAHGFMGIIDPGRKKIYDFQTGNPISRSAFEEVYKPVAEALNLEWVRVSNPLFFGPGDDSPMLEILYEYKVPESVISAIKGDYDPHAGIVEVGATRTERYMAHTELFFGGIDGGFIKLMDIRVKGLFNTRANPADRIANPVDWEAFRRETAGLLMENRFNVSRLPHTWLRGFHPPQP